jgi:hypothetical protein
LRRAAALRRALIIAEAANCCLVMPGLVPGIHVFFLSFR